MTDEAQSNYIRGVVEAVLFTSEKPVTLNELKDILEGFNGSDIKAAIKGLQKEYQEQERGMSIFEIAEGFQMLSNSKYAESIRQFYKRFRKEKLSKPALEVLAMVAYKQPVTRQDIEDIRGVNSDGVVAHLLEKGIIKIAGRKDVPGRPFLYGTSKQFLEYFGLKTLEDLPKLEEFEALQKEAEAEQQKNEDGQEQESQETREVEETEEEKQENTQAAEEVAVLEGASNESESVTQKDQ